MNETLWDTLGHSGSGNILQPFIIKLVAGDEPRKVSKLGRGSIKKGRGNTIEE